MSEISCFSLWQKVKCFLIFCAIQNGIQLKKTVEEEEEDGMISNKKPRKATLAKDKLYGCFVKVMCLFLIFWVNINGYLTMELHVTEE